ncbi:hypothetical protein SRHO_G00274400 [Serrasalmus rhombeus]
MTPSMVLLGKEDLTRLVVHLPCPAVLLYCCRSHVKPGLHGCSLMTGSQMPFLKIFIRAPPPGVTDLSEGTSCEAPDVQYRQKNIEVPQPEVK